MADQATSTSERSSIVADPETPATAGATVTAESLADAAAEVPTSPGFGARGRMRRRLRFLRKARELAYRDLGGLVFEMQRLGERRDELAAAKLATLAAIDTELRALEDVLGNRRTLTVLRESGIAACPRCAAIHGSDDRFCPACGLAMERQAERPIAAPAGSAVVTALGAPAAAAPPVAPATMSFPASQAPAPPVTPPPVAPLPVVPPPATSVPSRAPTTYRPVAAQAPANPQTPPGRQAPEGGLTPAGAETPAGVPPPARPQTPATQQAQPPPAADDRPTEIIRPPGKRPEEGA